MLLFKSVEATPAFLCLNRILANVKNHTAAGKLPWTLIAHHYTLLLSEGGDAERSVRNITLCFFNKLNIIK